MSRHLLSKRIPVIVSCVIAGLLTVFGATSTSFAQELVGHELLSVTRVAHGGSEYASLRYLTAYGDGDVSFTAWGVTPLGGGVINSVQVRLNATDYQDYNLRRRLEVSAPSVFGVVGGGPSYMVYTGSEAGGMFLGSRFRVNDVVASRQWSLMGFQTLNLAADRAVSSRRLNDEMLGGASHYVVEVFLNSDDRVVYWINKNTFLISKVATFLRYDNRAVIEEDRSDYRKVSCLMLPFHVVTRLRGERIGDMVISRYDIQTEVPSGRFTLTAIP